MPALWSDSALALGPQSTGLGKMVQEPRAKFKAARCTVLCNLPKIGIDHKTIKFV